MRDEVLRAGPDIPSAKTLHEAFAAGWLIVQPVIDAVAVEALTAELDRGEAEAIVFTHEARADLILLDERRARVRATQQGLSMTGTIGILRTARDRGLLPAVAPLFEELRRRGFRFSADLVEQIQQEEADQGQPRATPVSRVVAWQWLGEFVRCDGSSYQTPLVTNVATAVTCVTTSPQATVSSADEVRVVIAGPVEAEGPVGRLASPR